MQNTTFNDLNLEFRSSDRHTGTWLWPKEDIATWDYLNSEKHYNLPEIIAAYCKNKKLVIQAGGNAGLYPKQYSKLFDLCITIEPDYRNFFCLTFNVPESNVIKIQSCLGDTNELVSLEYDEKFLETNAGAIRVKKENGFIPQLRIDDLGVAPDLIHLDVEGFEGFALLGAEHTIKKHKPIIVCELNSLGINFGWSNQKINRLLGSWGYVVLKKMKNDSIFVHKDKEEEYVGICNEI